MGSRYKPDDGLFGAIVIGALVGFGGGAILGRSVTFGLVGALVLLGVVYFMVNGVNSDESGRTGKPE